MDDIYETIIHTGDFCLTGSGPVRRKTHGPFYFIDEMFFYGYNKSSNGTANLQQKKEANMSCPTDHWLRRLGYWCGTIWLLCLVGFGVWIALNRGNSFLAVCGCIVGCFVVYARVLCVTIPAHSLIVRRGWVVGYFDKPTIKMFWSKELRAARVVKIKQDDFLRYSYKAMAVYPSQGYRLCVCSVTVSVHMGMRINELQAFYDAFILVGSDGESMMNICVSEALATVPRPPLEISGKEYEMKQYVSLVFDEELEKKLSLYGLCPQSDCNVSFANKHLDFCVGR